MKKNITIMELIIIIFTVVIMKVWGQNNNSSQYIFVTQWGSIGDGDGQFGGIYIAPESTFIITDETLKCLKDKIWYKITKEIIEKLPDEIDKSKIEVIINKIFYEEEKFKSELSALNFNEDEIQIILKLASKKLDEEKLKILETLKNREFDKDNDHEFYYTLEELNFDDNEFFIIAEASALKRVSDRVVNGPMYIAVDKACNVYVSDFFNGRIQKFSSEGNFLTKWRCNSCPWGIAIDSKDYVYIVNDHDSCIQKFDSEGNFIIQWGKDGEFDLISGITVDSGGYIYVKNLVRFQSKEQVEIHKFNSNGDFIKKWVFSGHFGSMAIDPMGNLFILFYQNQFVSVLKYEKISNNDYALSNGECFIKKDFRRGISLTADSEGNLFIVDKKNHCIYKFDTNGNLITQWGSYGSGPGEFNRPEAAAVDYEGNVYVMDTGNYRIQKFAPNPEFKRNN